MGGEAIKAYQYFAYLLSENYDAYLCVHQRCEEEIKGHFPSERLIIVDEDKLDIALWRSRFGKLLLTQYFFLRAKKTILAKNFDNAIWHYVSPISPVEPRPVPRGIPVVIGPLNGNITYPSGFQNRLSARSKIVQRMHRPAQFLCRAVFGDKRRAQLILNSGFLRTRQSLSWAGVRVGNTLDVVDSGLPEYISNAEPIAHHGRNGRFVSLGRLVDFKGHDLAVRALSKCPDDATLTIYGEGHERSSLVALAKDLGLEDRVIFAGWLDHNKIVPTMAQYRGFVFPSLADANGIVMQEMMMLGLPVIALNWGGPSQLATAESAYYVDPINADQVVEQIAAAMTELSEDGDLATKIAKNARQIAAENFVWSKVGKAWADKYTELL